MKKPVSSEIGFFAFCDQIVPNRIWRGGFWLCFCGLIDGFWQELISDFHKFLGRFLFDVATVLSSYCLIS